MGGYFTWMTIYAVNQTMIQRYLTVKDLRLLLTPFSKIENKQKSFFEFTSVFNQDCQDLHLAQRSCHHCDPLHRCLCRAHHLHKVQKSGQVGIYSTARMCRMPNFYFPRIETGIFTVTQSHLALCQLKTSFSLFSLSTSLATFQVLCAIFVFFSWKTDLCGFSILLLSRFSRLLCCWSVLRGTFHCVGRLIVFAHCQLIRNEQ